MILTGNPQITQRSFAHNVTFFAINFTWTGTGPNPSFCGKKMTANHLTHGMAL